MLRLVEAQVSGVRRAVDVEFEVDPDVTVVLLHGRAGSGKSSALAGIGFGLAGMSVRDSLDPSKSLGKDAIRNPMFPAQANLTFQILHPEDPNPDTLGIHRDITKSGGHCLMVAGQKFANLGAAEVYVERALGATTDQLSYLASAERLVRMGGLEQAELLLGLMGGDLDLAWLMEKLGDEGPAWDWHSIVGERTGYPLLEAALAGMETNRTEQGRDKKRLASDAEKAGEVLQQALREAKVPGPDNLDAAAAQTAQEAERAAKHLSALKQRQAGAQDHQRRLQAAQERKARADAAVAEVREQRKAADAVREEREEERAVLAEKRDNALAAYEAARDTASEASAEFNVACERFNTWPNPDEFDAGDECPTCRQAVSEDALEQIRTTYEKYKTAKEEAAIALQTAREAVDRWDAEVIELKEALDACPPIPAADELEARFDAAVSEADEALTKLEAIQSEDAPAAPNAAEVEAAERNVADVQTRKQALTRAAEAKARVNEAQAAADEADALYGRYNKIVNRLREIIRETAEEAIGPVLERCNAMVEPQVTLGYDAEDGIVAVYGDLKRPVRELSTGERLMVGASLQASIAIELGVGVCLVDDLGNWDQDTFRLMLEHMVELGRTHWLTWILASTQLPLVQCADGAWVEVEMEGVQVVEVEGGYTS